MNSCAEYIENVSMASSAVNLRLISNPCSIPVQTTHIQFQLYNSRMAEWTGLTIGKVRIEKYLAHGGMAEVYLGTHLTLDRPVAVKVMHSYVESDPDLISRFEREARAVAGLRHPNIVQIYDFDTYQNHPYIVMEYLKGPSLASYMRDLHKLGAKLTLNQIARLLKSLADGIDYAHSQGIIHRDIKPANIILHNKSGEYSPQMALPADTQAIITDFGLVRIANSENKTLSGVVSGTPAYMSPEQAQGNPVDNRTDIYSLSVVLYEMLAGRPPFDGDSTLGVILKHIAEPPPPIEDASPEVQAVINKALEKLPENRYQTAHDLLADFYQAIGMNAEAETIHALQARTPSPDSVFKKKPASRNSNLLWIGGGLLVCLCFGVFLASALGVSAFAFLPGLGGGAKGTPTEPASVVIIPNTTGTVDPNHSSHTDEGNFLGVLRFQGDLNQVTVNATLPDPASGNQYEAWLIDDNTETLTSLGILEKNETSGQYTLTYTDSDSRNLLGAYNRMEITLESNPDDSPNPAANVPFSSGVPEGALTHIRHLLFSFPGTPNGIGLTIGLVNTTEQIQEAADAMLAAYQSGNDAAMQANAEAIVNLIVGSKSPDHKDWDGDKKINDPGDGFGILFNGDQIGYVEGTITHAELSAKAADASANVKLHSEHVAISGRNVEEWATQLRDLAMRIAQSKSSEVAEADIRLAVSLAKQTHEGIDIDGNERIDPIPGEGGAVSAFEHAVYMADMQIMEGENQIPPPSS